MYFDELFEKLENGDYVTKMRMQLGYISVEAGMRFRSHDELSGMILSELEGRAFCVIVHQGVHIVTDVLSANHREVKWTRN